MSYHRTIDDHGRTLYRDGEKYPFAEIIRRSCVGRSTLERWRASGRLWVYRDNPNCSRGDWVVQAFLSTTPRKLPKMSSDNCLILITPAMEKLMPAETKGTQTSQPIERGVQG